MKHSLETTGGKRSPFRELQQMQSNIDRLFDELTPKWMNLDSTISSNLNYFSPTCDVSEDATHYFLKFDMPGISREQIKVELVDNALTVTAERKDERKKEGLKQFISEVNFGSYMRTLTLPTSIDEKKIEATYSDGVLSITIPKVESSKAKQIAVH